MKESLEQRVKRLESEIAALKEDLTNERADQLARNAATECQVAEASKWLMNVIQLVQAQNREIPSIKMEQKPQ